jgi:hypothetical protein
VRLRDDSWSSTLRVLLSLWLVIHDEWLPRADTGFAYTQHPSIHNGAPGDVPDLRTYTHIDSNETTGQQNLMQAVRLVNRDLSSWTLRPLQNHRMKECIFE